MPTAVERGRRRFRPSMVGRAVKSRSGPTHRLGKRQLRTPASMRR